jgi:hypothetical protein
LIPRPPRTRVFAYSGAQNYDNITAASHNFSGDGFLLPLKRITIILCVGAGPVGAISPKNNEFSSRRFSSPAGKETYA